MATRTFCLIQLVVVTLNIFLVFKLVVAKKGFCASVFETQLGKYFTHDNKGGRFLNISF